MPRIGLFVPCYIDQFYPDVGLATVEVLEKLGCDVHFPQAQTCCGQPMANTGCVAEAASLAERYLTIFREFEYVVCPSGSCTSMVRRHYPEILHGHGGQGPSHHDLSVCERTYEFTEFLVDVLKVRDVGVSFPHRVGLHQSCHGLRELRLGSSSETVGPAYNKARQLLETARGIQLVDLTRADECCGFGGTFAVNEEAVSCMMGLDRIHDHEQAGAEVITANDMSCLMHLQGLIRRQKKPLAVMHVAQILAGRPVVQA